MIGGASPWMALNSLSRTMRDRGGVTPALLAGVDATTGLKRAEFEIERGRKADVRADEALGLQKQADIRQGEAAARQAEEFNLRKPALQRQADEEKYLNEEIPINIKDYFPNTPSGALHFNLPRSSDGKSLHDDINTGLNGSGYDSEGYRIYQDGKRVTMPRWKWEQKYKPAIMFTYLSKTDPVKLLNDKAWEAKTALENTPPMSAEYQKRKAEYDQINATLNDKTSMAALYGKKVEAISEGIAWGIQNNADPRYLTMLGNELTESRTQFHRNADQLTETEKLKIKDLKASVDLKEAQAKEAIAKASEHRASAQKKLSGTGDMNDYQYGRLAAEAHKIVNKEDEDRALSPQGPMTPEEKQARYDQVLKSLLPKQNQAASPQAGLEPPKIRTGQDAIKEAQRQVKLIEAGSVNEKQLLDSLLASGQNDVVRNIVGELKKRRTSTQNKTSAKASAKPVEPQKSIEQLREDEEKRRIEQIEKERKALKKPTDWGAIYNYTNRNIR